MIHSHCYVVNGKYTEMTVPCGSLDEITEIKKVIEKDYDGNYELTSYKINYLGHGCLLLGNSISDLKTAKFISRVFPEKLQNVDEILDKGIDIIKGNKQNKQLEKQISKQKKR